MTPGPDSQTTSEEEYRNIFEAVSDGLVIYDIALNAVVEGNSAACEMHGYTRQVFIALNPAVFILADSHALFRDQVRTAEAGSIFESLSVHRRRDGSPFHVEVRNSMINHRDRPCVLSIIRDVSQRIQKEKALGREIQARMREPATLLAISHTLASTLEFQPGLILDQLREVIEYTCGGLFVLEDSSLVTPQSAGRAN